MPLPTSEKTAPELTAQRRPPLRPIAALLPAVGGAVVLWLRNEDALTGTAGVLLLLTTLLLLPVSSAWTTRLVAVGLVYYGGASTLLWMPWPRGLDVAGLVLSVLVAAHLHMLLTRRELYRVLAQTRPSDGLLVVTGLVAAVTQHRLVLARRPEEALDSLLSGWDNAPHYMLIEQVRDSGRALMYQIYDPFVALTMSVAAPDHGDPAGAEILLAARTQGWLLVGGAVVAVAAIMSWTGQRRSTAAHGVVAALLLAVLLAGPGGILPIEGFRNFWFRLRRCHRVDRHRGDVTAPEA